MWDGFFGADVKELRMQLPDLYPSSTTPYDQNEDFEARTLAEAIVSSLGGVPANSSSPTNPTSIRSYFSPLPQLLTFTISGLLLVES